MNMPQGNHIANNTFASVEVLIVEQSAIVRNGMAGVLASAAMPVSVTVAQGVDTAVELFNTLHPQLVMINPRISRATVLLELCREAKCSVIALISSILTSDELDSYDAFITINDTPDDIISKIVRVLNVRGVESSASRECEPLSEREKEIVVCVVMGMTNREIAQHFALSVHTVITHRRSINHKLKLHTTASLALWAIRHGLVSL